MRDAPDHMKLGYEKNRETDAIREEILAGGFDGDEAALWLACENEWQRRHANDPTYRERQAAWLARQPKNPARPAFDDDEIAYIAERLAGSNSEIGQRILRKIGGPAK